ncbi:MAG: hypothetical protein QM520_03940, partial [Gammaproteobacteria bacterium]|nr:hypothetical protein [Gammaproteobacteria bacterium]
IDNTVFTKPFSSTELKNFLEHFESQRVIIKYHQKLFEKYWVLCYLKASGQTIWSAEVSKVGNGQVVYCQLPELPLEIEISHDVGIYLKPGDWVKIELLTVDTLRLQVVASLLQKVDVSGGVGSKTPFVN